MLLEPCRRVVGCAAPVPRLRPGQVQRRLGHAATCKGIQRFPILCSPGQLGGVDGAIGHDSVPCAFLTDFYSHSIVASRTQEERSSLSV